MPYVEPKNVAPIMFGLMLSLFLANLDQTIIATCLPAIAHDLQGWELLPWVISAYLVTSTATTPIYGRLSDHYGRRPVMLAAIGHLRRGVDILRSGDHHAAADRRAHLAGPRRRRPALDQPDRHRRHHSAALSRPISGLHVDDVPDLDDARPGSRRFLRRTFVVAMGVLDQLAFGRELPSS